MKARLYLFLSVCFYLWLYGIGNAASLLVHTQPPGCQVILDNQYLGITDEKGDLYFENLTPGPHKIILEKDGFEGYSKDVIAKDLTVNISAALKPLAGKEVEAGKGTLFKKMAVILAGFLIFSLSVFIVLFLVYKKRHQPVFKQAEKVHEKSKEFSTPKAIGETNKIEPPLQLLTPPPSKKTDFGNYLLLAKIKEGGMARIYKAKHKSKEGFYVLKIPYAQQLSDPSYKERFLHEAKLRESLSHPNIVKIWDAGEVNGLPFFAMEYVEGSNLRDILNNINHLSEKQAINVISSTCEALDYAHNKGVLHKDLKPENLLCSGISKPGDEVKVIKVIDFGLYQEWEGRTGTPPYMAPEQARKEEVDARADLFALGVIFYELLTGIRLFSAPTSEETIELIIRAEEVTLPNAVNPILQRIISSLLKKDKNQRLSSASMVINALDAYRFHYH